MFLCVKAFAPEQQVSSTWIWHFFTNFTPQNHLLIITTPGHKYLKALTL